MSIEARARGGRTRYVARWRHEGRQRERTFDKRRDAEAFERERRREQALGVHGPAEPSPMTLGEWVRRWWDLGAPTWAPSTRRQRASVLDRWLIPHLGGVRLRDLGPARVRTWRGAVLSDGCSPTQANAALSVLSAALGSAVEEGLLPANPASRTRKLAVAVSRPRALSPHEVERIRAAMPSVRDVVMLGLLAYAGLRPGEALALTWGSVGRVLVIDRAVSEGQVRQTKTNRRRTVELLGPLGDDLELLRPRVAGPEALVVATGTGGVLDLHNWRERVWRPACAEAQVKASPYDGRHTYASLLIHEGRSLPYVTAALGHASAVTTLSHYAHLIDDARLGAGVPMSESIACARAALETRGVWPMCARDAVRVLRSPTEPVRNPALAGRK